MGLELENLDFENVRTLMMEELDLDIQNGNLYISKRLIPEFYGLYEDLLKDAIINGTPDSLAICFA